MLPGSRCKHCKGKLSEEERSQRKRLHDSCLDAFAESFAAKQARKMVAKQKQEKALEAKALRARKAALKTIPELLKEAQVEFNSWVRERDRLAGHRCISSGRILCWDGNSVDAGHYRSVGAAPHLRFDERNCHAQSKHDNQYKAGNVVGYRIGLIERLGIEAVEALESDNRTHKWQRDELIEIRDRYRKLAKELKAQRA